MQIRLFVLIAMCLTFVYNMAIAFLQKRSERNKIPANVADVYDQPTYERWRAYHAEKLRLAGVRTVLSFVIELVLMFANLYAAFAALFPAGAMGQMFAVLLLNSVGDILLLPLAYRDTITIEEKYGFNRSTMKTFVTDQIKSFILSLLLFFLVGTVLLRTHQRFGGVGLLIFFLALILIIFLISLFTPKLTRLFNKFVPLEEGELRTKLTGMLEKHGYRVKSIDVMDASRRTTKGNAYFTGFGKRKEIVLYDTLIAMMTPDEICAVFAHEMGHGLHKDMLKNALRSFATMAVIALLTWLTLSNPEFCLAFGFEATNYGFILILTMGVIMALINPLLGLMNNYFSRKAEYRADQQAVEEGYGGALVEGLKKLSRGNFSDLSPDPWLVKLEYSHPTLSQRIEQIQK